MEKNLEDQIEIINAQWLPLDKIVPNNGQVDGIPPNPRTIEPDTYEKLKKSITDNPEMLGLRDCYVKVHQGTYVMMDGNMRLKALQELGFTKTVCKIIPEHWTAEQVKALIIKANIPFGDWDKTMLSDENDWDQDQLREWGVDMETSFEINLDGMFNEEAPKAEKKKELICPHCGKNIYEEAEQDETEGIDL